MRLTTLFATDEHAEVEATWGVYQRLIAAYRDPDYTLDHEEPDSMAHASPR